MKINNNLIGELNNYKQNQNKPTKSDEKKEILVRDKLEIKSKAAIKTEVTNFDPKEMMAKIKKSLKSPESLNAHGEYNRDNLKALLED